MNEHRTRTNRRDEPDQGTTPETITVLHRTITGELRTETVRTDDMLDSVRRAATGTGTTRPQGDR